MIIKYTPGDGDKQVWDFAPDKVLDDAAEEIEYHFKGTYDEFHVGVVQGATRARRVLLWHLMREVHPTLAFADVPRFRRGELEVEFDKAELLVMRQRTVDAVMSPTDRERALAYLDGEIAKHVTPEDIAPKGKASPTGATTTASKSPRTSGSRPSSSEA